MKLIIFPHLVLMTFLSGCSNFFESESINRFNFDKNSVGIQSADATRRIAIVYPNGNVCSEMTPSVVKSKSIDQSASANAGKRNANLDIDESFSSHDEAKKLSVASERIECLRISLFHACGLASVSDLEAEKVKDLYVGLIESCSKWQPEELHQNIVDNINTARETDGS